MNTDRQAERDAIQAATRRLLAGTPTHSTGALTVLQLAAEAGVKRWVLTHKHPDLRQSLRRPTTGHPTTSHRHSSTCTARSPTSKPPTTASAPTTPASPNRSTPTPRSSASCRPNSTSCARRRRYLTTFDSCTAGRAPRPHSRTHNLVNHSRGSDPDGGPESSGPPTTTGQLHPAGPRRAAARRPAGTGPQQGCRRTSSAKSQACASVQRSASREAPYWPPYVRPLPCRHLRSVTGMQSNAPDRGTTGCRLLAVNSFRPRCYG